ncbi:hypothetical protein ElyMa_001739300 [Elysia marginata]|uniref:Uncharacterized protein n=1 Tax=Elysia marginata TaxID=1093978 RepID=A0AAV4K1M0_9GAST|nr:hypothetical protein ElyMa_001739300 [Elysia marginata]
MLKFSQVIPPINAAVLISSCVADCGRLFETSLWSSTLPGHRPHPAGLREAAQLKAQPGPGGSSNPLRAAVLEVGQEE